MEPESQPGAQLQGIYLSSITHVCLSICLSILGIIIIIINHSSSSCFSFCLHQDTEGLKVGVASLITQWVKGPADGGRQSAGKPAVRPRGARKAPVPTVLDLVQPEFVQKPREKQLVEPKGVCVRGRAYSYFTAEAPKRYEAESS